MLGYSVSFDKCGLRRFAASSILFVGNKTVHSGMRFEILCGLVLFILSLASCTAQPPVAHSEPTKVEAEAETPLSALLSLLPDEDRSYVLVHCAKNWIGREAEALKFVTEAHPMVGTHNLLKLAADVGVKPAEVATVVSTSAGSDSLLILELIDQATARRLLPNLVPSSTTKTIGGHEVCVGASSGDAAMLFGERYVVRGTSASIESLAVKPAAKPSETVRCFLTAASGVSLLAADFPTSALRFPNDAELLSNLQLDPLLKSKRWRITVDGMQGLKFVVRGEFADAEAAKAGEEALPRYLHLVRMSLETSEEVLTPYFRRKPKTFPRGPEVMPRFKQALAETRKAFENPSIKTDGNDVEAVAVVGTEQPLVTAAMLMSLNPRARIPTEDDN